jgi:hypothetical protein
VKAETGEAVFSEDRLYRYELQREWSDNPKRMNFIGLNPSTADEAKLDPTLRRMIRFADREGCGRLIVTNLFAFRATDPLVMRLADDPVGPKNDSYLVTAAEDSAIVVAGWGANGGYRGRNREVEALLKHVKLRCLGFTVGGHPRHPLYLSSETALVAYV